MKKIIGILISVIFIFLFISENIYATVYVKGYYRSDGTYVAPYTRNEPSKNNNYKFYEFEYKKNNKNIIPNRKINKYIFYKTKFLKNKEENKINIPTEAELYEKRLKESEEREKKRNERIRIEEEKRLQLKWENKINENIKKYKKNQKSIDFLNEGMKLAKKSLCKNTEECVNAIYFYKKSLENNNRKDVLNSLDNLYLMLAAQYNKQKKYNNAIKYILLSKIPENKKMVKSLLSSSYNGLAKDYYNNGKYENAIEYGLLASTKGVDNIWYSYYIIGLSSFEIKEYKNALFYFKKSLQNTKNKESIKSLNYNINLSKKKIEEIEKLSDNLIEGIVNGKCGIKSKSDKNGNCICENGYEWEKPNNNENFDCKKIEEEKENLCGINSIIDINSKNNCICKEGYEWKNETGLDCKKIEKKEENLCGVNSIIDINSENDCICKEGYEWKNETGLDCIEKQSLIYRKKLDKKLLIKLDKILPKILNKSEKQLIKLNKKIDLLLKKKLNTKTKNIILFLKYSIEEKLNENNELDLEELLK